MSLSKSVTASAVAALLVAVSVVAIISISGVPPARLTQNGATGPITSSTTTLTTSSHTTSSQFVGGTSTASQGVPGSFSILLTDPPRVPSGVTAVYVYYIGLAVHGVQGWNVIKSAGEIELMGTVNLAQTISSVSLPAGTYDIIKFDVASAQVTFQGTNHTAVVQGGDLTIGVVGDESVSSSHASAVLIDIQPTVINVGSSSSPQFVLWASAMAFPLPQGQVTADLSTEGHRLSLAGLSWWSDDESKSSTTIQLSGASVSANYMSVSVKDVGTENTRLRIVMISTTGPAQNTPEAQAVPPTMTGSAVFVVLDNGTLRQFLPLLHIATPYIAGESQLSVYDVLLKAGYNLTASSSVQLSYSGPIELSFGLLAQPLGITAGSTYWITIIGDNTVSTISATAS